MSKMSSSNGYSPIRNLPPNQQVDQDYAYKSLQHRYSVLENEFHLYSSETLSKINGLENDMDELIAEKDRA